MVSMVTMIITNGMWQYVWLPQQGIGVGGRVRYGLWSAGEGGEETCGFGCFGLNYVWLG
jgi:hypothetical protein